MANDGDDDAHAYAGLGDSRATTDTESTMEDLLAAASCTGRSTLFCCLSCGMPYSFPDNAYMSADQQVKLIPSKTAWLGLTHM